jgi:cytochrome d ubiquinol oxidase subunit I
MVFLGTWSSGLFIILTNAWIQHPVGYTQTPGGGLDLPSYSAVLLNSWAGPQYLHTVFGAVI